MKTQSGSKAGFSLVEVMVAMTIGLFIMASSYATIMSLAKGSQSMINFSEMNGQTRIALEMFGRDSRMAYDVTTATATELTMNKRLWLNSTNDYRNCAITWQFVPQAGTFSRTVVRLDNGATVEDRILLYDVDALNFTYYSLIDPTSPWVSPTAHNNLEIKHVQLEAKLERKVLSIDNTNYIISARFMMRNKDVSSL